ncbi:putative Cytochrome c oxidase subunit 5B mitochondrial protein, partial [Naja naja]
ISAKPREENQKTSQIKLYLRKYGTLERPDENTVKYHNWNGLCMDTFPELKRNLSSFLKLQSPGSLDRDLQGVFSVLKSRINNYGINLHSKYFKTSPHPHRQGGRGVSEAAITRRVVMVSRVWLLMKVTGMERKVLDTIKKGVDPYGVYPSKLFGGTKDNPHLVPSLTNVRLMGCIC